MIGTKSKHFLPSTLYNRYTYKYEGEMIEVATDRENIGKGVEIFVNIARMLFETLEGQVFKVRHNVPIKRLTFHSYFLLLGSGYASWWLPYCVPL